MNNDLKIVKCEIKKESFDSAVYATFEDGTNAKVFSFYSDEIHFSECELIGLTAKQARDLKYRKDLEYLRS